MHVSIEKNNVLVLIYFFCEFSNIASVKYVTNIQCIQDYSVVLKSDHLIISSSSNK